jgi:hypothetical protein
MAGSARSSACGPYVGSPVVASRPVYDMAWQITTNSTPLNGRLSMKCSNATAFRHRQQPSQSSPARGDPRRKVMLDVMVDVMVENRTRLPPPRAG